MSRQPILLAILLPFILPALAATPAPSSLPALDFSRMGTVGLGGSFAGLDWWSEQSPFASSSSSSSTPRFSADGDTVFIRSADGGYKVVGVTNAGGVMNDLCWLSGEGNGTIYIGGSFTSINGQAASNIASYSLSSSSWSTNIGGLTGTINTLSCDTERKEVWVGGSFTRSNGNGSNVALWSTSSSSWQPVPFIGLNGPVSVITPNPANSNIFIGGSFSTSFSSNSTRNVTSNYTSTPSAPTNTSTTGNSGYLTPVTLPAASSAQGQLTITAGPATADPRYNDPKVLLCPGSGTWLALENQVSDVNLLGYNFWRASGARVTNGLVEGRGATSFCLTTIPDNVQLNMTYTDPKTGRNATCWDHCPLSTDASVGGQDFVFTDGPRNMTGLQIQLKTWIGAGAALSSVQLLSPGASVSSSSDGNSGVCPGASTSSVRTTGDWTQGTVATSLPATTAFYIKSQVQSPPTSYPSVTFYPQVSSSGYYDVYLPIPACSKTEDCGSRTTVDITVFPREDGSGWTSSISEVTEVDQSILVYSGWTDRTSAEFTPTVMLALSKSPQGTSTGQFSIVAQSVELVLTGIGNPGETPRTSTGGIVGQNGTITTNTTRIGTTSQANSFGVFEYRRGGATVNAATGSLSNSSVTALTRLGSALLTARNGSAGASGWSVNAIVPLGNIIYVGGQLAQSGNWSHVLAIDTSSNATVALPNGGLNGIVYAAAAIGQSIYFGGNFTGTATSSNVNSRYIVRYDTSSKAWSAVAGGVDGVVTGLTVISNQLLVSGNFTRTLSANGDSTSTGGYAVYDTSSSSWSTSGVLFGSLAAATPAGNGNTILAGRVLGSSSNAVNGIALLSTGSNGAEISTLPGVSFSSTGSSALSSAPARRHLQARHERRSWMNRLTAVLAPVVSRELAVRAPAPSIPLTTASAPAVLAGGFWTNSSTSGRPQVTILGGNFSTNNNIGGLGFYSNNALSGPVPPVSGVVRTVAVIGNTVYAAGSSVNVTGVGSGLVAYDLAAGRWSTNRIPSLNPQSGGTLLVNSIRQRDSTDTVVVAGNFGSAGGLACAAVCLWDVGSGQWSSPGSGLSSGEVRAIDFAGNDHDVLVAAGSFVMPTGETAYAATYTFSDATWRPLNTLPGPALAIAVDNKNASSIFAAGYSTSDGSAYLSQWTGNAWTAQNSSLLPGSIVSQLAFVPLQKEHSGSGLMERDRMLMMSGNLYLDSVGNATSALYDGSRSYPYLAGVSSGGGLASSSNLFWSESSFDFTIRRYLATGLVVLVAMAIATGLILLLILLFLLIGYCLRRKERKQPHQEMYNKDPADMDTASAVSSTHQNVLHTVQNAIEVTLIGASPAAAIAAAKHRSRDSAESRYAYAADESEEEEEGGRESTMRYDFDGPELQPGEMAMRAGQKVVVLDDQQSEEWWYCRDPVSGREGVVPATYVW